MSIIEHPQADRRIVLHGVAWPTYEALLHDLADSSSPRLAFSEGILEMMSPSDEHEDCKHVLRRMIEIWAEQRDVPFRATGSRTWKSSALQRGVEPDEAYYIRHEQQVRGKRELDLSRDPPPDLALEVEITHSSVDKLEIYAVLGIPELWRFDGETLRILELNSAGHYVAREQSLNLPGFPVGQISHWRERHHQVDETAWAREFRESARISAP
jgi:Uma2 family endonuclease